MMCVMASFRSVIQEGSCLRNLVTTFSIFILTHPQEKVWPDGPTHFGLKTVLCLECACPEEQISFCLVLYMHTHIRKNQECGQMWSGSIHYGLISGIERTEEGRRKKIKKKYQEEKNAKIKKNIRGEKEPRPGIWHPLFSLGTFILTTAPVKAFFIKQT